MFVESMTFEEIRREFDKDRVPLLRKAVFHSQHVKKLMRQTKATQLDKYYDWLSPNKNRWTYRFDVDFNRGKSANFFVSQYCIFFTEKSYAVINYAINVDRVTYFTSHFFTRYFQRERLPKENIHEVVRTFMMANGTYATQPLKLKYENEFDAFIQMKEGVAFGSLHKDLNLVTMRTFITNDMLKGDQIDLSKKLDEQFQLGALRKKE